VQNMQKTKPYRKCKSLESDSYSLKKGKWRAATLVNTLRIAKIRSNLHTGQYAGSIISDHSQGQVLLKPLSLPGLT